jgi:hypothetical protein
MPTFITRDYVVSKKRSYGSLPPDEYYYASIIGSLNSEPAQESAAMLQKHAGQLSKLRVQVVLSGDSGNASITLCKQESGGNWEATALSVSISDQDPPGLYEDNTHTVTFGAEARLCWRIDSNTGGGGSFTIRSIAAQVSDQQ